MQSENQKGNTGIEPKHIPKQSDLAVIYSNIPSKNTIIHTFLKGI